MKSKTEDLELTVVIPCLDEEESLALCIEKAKTAMKIHGIRGEVVVCDNGSTDRSVEIAESFGARVEHQPLKGYGNALRKGIEESLGKFIIMGDADDSYDFSILNEFVEKWREGYDFVMGSRMRGNILDGAMPWHHRLIGNPVLTWILNFLFKAGISDAHCGFRGFTKEAYDKMDIRTTGMEFASELVIKAAKLQLKITEIPIILYPDKRTRPPHLRSFRDGWRHLRFMIMLSPFHLFFIPGIVSIIAGIILLMALYFGPITIAGITIDYHTMFFGMVFVLIGMHILITGLFVRVFSYTERFSYKERSLEKYFKRISLETGLILGGSIALIGAVVLLNLFLQWRQTGFGSFDEIRSLIIGATFFLVGVQIIFSSFFLSMLGISRDTYMGDYEKKLPTE